MDELTLTNLTEEIKDEIDALPEVTYSSFVAKKKRKFQLKLVKIILGNMI